MRQHLGHFAGSLPQIDNLQPQGLLAREGQQLSNQPLAAHCGAHNGGRAPLDLRAPGPARLVTRQRGAERWALLDGHDGHDPTAPATRSARQRSYAQSSDIP
jgi:hypothetical protein